MRWVDYQIIIHYHHQSLITELDGNSDYNVKQNYIFFYHDTKSSSHKTQKNNVMNELIINDAKIDLSHATSNYEPHKMDGFEYG